MKIKDIIGESQLQEQRLDEFLPLALAALGGTAAGATLGDYLLQKRKGEKDWNFGQSVGRNIERGEKFVTQKAAPAAEKFAKDVYKGYTGKDAPENLDQWLDDLGAYKVPYTLDNVEKIKKQADIEYNRPWTEPDLNEESKKKSSFEIEVEKNFQDPYIRKAIMAKARHESGNANVGEKSYAGSTNAHIRKVFHDKPKLLALSDAELTALKKNPEAFYDTVYGHIGGYKYRGRGPIQITGKANYARIDKDLGLNGALVKDPDMLLRDPQLANAASVQYLKNAGIHKKTVNNQKEAHEQVIYAIGGPLYAPGSKRAKQVLAQVEKLDSLPATATVAATTAATTKTGQGGKPSTSSDQPSDADAKVSTPPSQPRDIAGRPQTYVYTGPTVKDVMRKFDKDDADKKAELKFVEPKSVVPTAEPPKYEPGPNQKGNLTTPVKSDSDSSNKDTEVNPFGIAPATKSNLDREKVGSGYTRIPESVNTETELTDILRLAGRNK